MFSAVLRTAVEDEALSISGMGDPEPPRKQQLPTPSAGDKGLLNEDPHVSVKQQANPRILGPGGDHVARQGEIEWLFLISDDKLMEVARDCRALGSKLFHQPKLSGLRSATVLETEHVSTRE